MNNTLPDGAKSLCGLAVTPPTRCFHAGRRWRMGGWGGWGGGGSFYVFISSSIISLFKVALPFNLHVFPVKVNPGSRLFQAPARKRGEKEGMISAWLGFQEA